MCPNARGTRKFLLVGPHTDRRGMRLLFAGNRCFVVSIACHGSQPKPLSRPAIGQSEMIGGCPDGVEFPPVQGHRYARLRPRPGRIGGDRGRTPGVTQLVDKDAARAFALGHGRDETIRTVAGHGFGNRAAIVVASEI
jgi:hypothetical protein